MLVKKFDAEALEERINDFEAKHGRWTAHNYELFPGRMSMPQESQPLTTLFCDLLVRELERPLDGLRIVDFACLEGGHTFQFADLGAIATGIEGRSQNLVKAQFANELKKTSVEFVLDDVRNFSVDKYGMFDVIFCRGIFYHLNAPDLFHFIQRMQEACGGIILLDTHFSTDTSETLRPELNQQVTYLYRGVEYRGRIFPEHEEDATEEALQSRLWTALANKVSVWLDHDDIPRLMSQVGFVDVHEERSIYQGLVKDRSSFIGWAPPQQRTITKP